MTTGSISILTGFAHLTDLPCYQLEYGHATAVISVYGAHVMSYRPQPDQEILWVSPLAGWQDGAAIRGGVPVCWPWFGPVAACFNPEDKKLPNHGLVRNRLWQFHAQQIADDSVSISLSIHVDDLPHSEASAELYLTLTLTAHQLHINLQCNQPLLQQAALHSYFNIRNIHQTSVTPLPATCTDKVLNGQLLQNLAPKLHFTSETDRVYHRPATELSVHSSGHQLRLQQQGHDSAIVWNPWQERSSQLADIPDDGYLEFVCVETARLSIEKAAPLNLTQSISAAVIL